MLVGSGIGVFVAVAGTGVLDGDGLGVLVGGAGVLVGETGVFVAVGSGVKDGSGVSGAGGLVAVLPGVAVTSRPTCLVITTSLTSGSLVHEARTNSTIMTATILITLPSKKALD